MQFENIHRDRERERETCFAETGARRVEGRGSDIYVYIITC